MSPLPEVVARIGEVVLWIPTDLCSEAISSIELLTHLGVWHQILGPSQSAYEIYLCRLGRQIRGAVVIEECAGEDLLIRWLGHWDAVWVPAIMPCLFVLWFAF